MHDCQANLVHELLSLHASGLRARAQKCCLDYPYGCPLAAAMLACTIPPTATGGAATAGS